METRIDYIHSLWRQGNALQVGESIYRAIPVAKRPKWAKTILEVCKEQHPVVKEIEVVCELAEVETEWSKAHDAFTNIRLLTLKYEAEDKRDPIYGTLLHMAENAAKIVYNASGHPAPFDKDCGDWLVVCAHDMVKLVDESEFEKCVWQAIVSSSEDQN